MANVYEIGGIIYVEAPFAASVPQVFWLNGSRYFQLDNGTWLREWVDPRGLLRREVANVRFVQGLAPFAVPTSLRLRPVQVWPAPTGGPVYSWHVDSRRWVRVLAYLNEQGGVEIPLRDANGAPWFGMGAPPRAIVRRDSTVNVDHIGSVDTGVWQDIGVGLRPGGPFDVAKRTFGATQQCYWSLKALTDPVPHWVLRIQTAFQGIGANHTWMIDLLGEGGGSHASTFREVGSASTVGHWRADLMWTAQPFGATSAVSVLNERKRSQGSIDVANDPEPGTTPATLFLTTGANAGLVTGTALYTVMPFVQVFGHAVLGSYASATETDWQPESWGMGASALSAAAITSSGAERGYFSEVFKDGSGQYAVRVYNIGANVGGGAPDAALNRTFFVFAGGK